MRAPAVLLGAAAALALSAWGARRAATTIAFAHDVDPSEKPAIEELLKRFQVETGIIVTSVDLKTKGPLEKRIEAGRPDGREPLAVFGEDNVKLLPLVQRGLVEDLSDVHVEHADVRLVPPEVRRYFLSFRPNVQITYVGKEALREVGATAPKSLDEVEQVARKFRGRGGTGKITLSLADGDAAAVTVAELILSFNGDPLALNDPGSVAAFTFLQRMWGEHLLAPESRTAQYDTQLDYLKNGTSWLAQTWPFTSTVLARAHKLADFEVYPGSSPAHVIGGDVLGIAKGLSPNERKAARALVKFLMSRDSQRFLAKQNAWPSIREDAYTGIWWGGCGRSRCEPWVSARQVEHKDTLDAAHRALQQTRWLRPSTKQWDQATSAITTALHRIVYGNEDLQTVLDELHDQVTRAGASP